MPAERVKVAFASGPADLLPDFVEKLRNIAPELPLYLVSEFQPAASLGPLRWIPFDPLRDLSGNRALVDSALRGRSVEYAAVILQPRTKNYRPMRRLALRFAPWRVLFFNENLDHFTVRPSSMLTLARHFYWRARERVRRQIRPGGELYTWLWRMVHPSSLARPIRCRLALLAGALAARRKQILPRQSPHLGAELPAGISVVIPSRNGRDLLARGLPAVVADLHESGVSQLIVVDNGSEDGTADWLRREYPEVEALVHAKPLSFARAVNEGIHAARYSHVCLLNNDMVVEPGFFGALRAKFTEAPDLFCATAQIFFPPGERRQETGKAVMPPVSAGDDPAGFPVTCLEPAPGEDGSYVLYGSGGCSLFDTRKLRALGGFGVEFEPAYVEDLDLGFRGWLEGWPCVFTAGARVVHRHRATTSRYYSQAELDRVLEVNYLRFLVRCFRHPALFQRMWRRAVQRLNLLAARDHPAALPALVEAWSVAHGAGPAACPAFDEESVLAVGNGQVSVFPGTARHAGRPLLLVMSDTVDADLVARLRRWNGAFDVVALAWADHAPAADVLALAVEWITVRPAASWWQRPSDRPAEMDRCDSETFRMALRLAIRKWRPALAHMENLALRPYAEACRQEGVEACVMAGAAGRAQRLEGLAAVTGDWELRRQAELWRAFEDWMKSDSACRYAAPLPAVDVARFAPGGEVPEAERVLFAADLRDPADLLGLAAFLREAWPAIRAAHPAAALQVISETGYREHCVALSRLAEVDWRAPGLEVVEGTAEPEDYSRAAVVIAPQPVQPASRRPILEALAMGKAIVATSEAVAGLELRPGGDCLLADAGSAMADAVVSLFADAGRRDELGRAARSVAENRFDASAVARLEWEFYQTLLPKSG